MKKEKILSDQGGKYTVPYKGAEAKEIKETNHTLPDWFNGTVYDEGETITNPFSGESYDLNAGETSMYDLIMGINYVGDHRGWDDELIKLHQDALSWFRTVNPKAYMVLLD